MTRNRHDESGYVYWTVGPNDGSAPYVTVNEDAQQSWGYSSAWANQTVSASAGCAVAEPAIAPDAPTTDPGVAIDTTAPKPIEPSPRARSRRRRLPVGVPTADEAEARTRDLMTAVGLDPAAFKFETTADQWYASVNATEQLDGQFAGRSFSTGFGAEGVLQYAGGVLAEPAPGRPVSADRPRHRDRPPQRPERVLHGRLRRRHRRSTPRSQLARWLRPTAGVDVAEADVASVPSATAPTAPPASRRRQQRQRGAAQSLHQSASRAISEPVPVSIPTPQEVTVTLVDVQPDVWWVWDVDGTAWLLPAYRFIGDDGGWYTVRP